ncbi:hypothetical protein ABPG72_004600 [Tetrahymena utriculariae]
MLSNNNNNNNNQTLQRRSTPSQQQQQQRRILLAQKTSDEPQIANNRNIRITTQAQQKYVPSANRQAQTTTQNQNSTAINVTNKNNNRITEKNSQNQENQGQVVQSNNRVIERQQTLMKQNNDITQRTTIISNNQSSLQKNTKPSGQQQSSIRNEQKPSFMIRKTNNNTIQNKSSLVNNSSQNSNQQSQLQQQNKNTASSNTASNNSGAQKLTQPNAQNNLQSPTNPIRKYKESTNQNITSNYERSNPNNLNDQTNSIPSLSQLNGNNNQNNVSSSNSQIPSSSNLNNFRSTEQPNIANRRLTSTNAVANVSANTQNLHSNQISQNNNNIFAQITQQQSNNEQNSTHVNSYHRTSQQENRIFGSSNLQNTNSQNISESNTQQRQQNNQIQSSQLRTQISNPLSYSSLASQLANLRGNNPQRDNIQNTVNAQPRQVRQTINTDSNPTLSQNNQASGSQRLTGPDSQWLRETQNALQSINSILSQTNNALNRADNLSENVVNTNISSSASTQARNARINPFSPSNSETNNRQESAVEEMQRDLELLSQQRRQQEQQILARQAFEDRMARANHQVRQIIRDDYRRNNGRDMSDNSSEDESKEEEEEEEQKTNGNNRLSRLNRLIRNRNQSSSSSDSDSEEEKKDEQDRDRDRGRTSLASSSVPPVRNNSNTSNVHLLNFRNRANNEAPDQSSSNNNGPSQTLAQRLGINFDMVYNSRSENPSQRPPGSFVQRLIEQSNQNSQNRPNNQNQPAQNGGVRTFRVTLPINPNNVNQRNLLEGLSSLVNQMNSSLGNLSGSINTSRLEELAQWVATIRLLQQFTQPRKLSEEQLREFPVFLVKEVEENEICSICLDEWQINDQAKILGCMHKFHPKCIDDWLKEKTICPYCKQDQIQFFSDKIPENLMQQ